MLLSDFLAKLNHRFATPFLSGRQVVVLDMIKAILQVAKRVLKPAIAHVAHRYLPLPFNEPQSSARARVCQAVYLNYFQPSNKHLLSAKSRVKLPLL